MNTRTVASLIGFLFAGCASSAGQSSLDAGGSVDVVAAADARTSTACRAASDCGPGEVCVFAATNSCDAAAIGQCTPTPECFATEAFCACDNNTTYRDCVPTRPTLNPGACYMSIPVCPTPPVSIDAEGRCLDTAGNPPPLPSCCTGTFDCDDRAVACDIQPPACGPVWVPSVVGHGAARCYGPCVPQGRCAPVACDPNDPSIQCASWAVCDAASRTCVHR